MKIIIVLVSCIAAICVLYMGIRIILHLCDEIKEALKRLKDLKN